MLSSPRSNAEVQQLREPAGVADSGGHLADGEEGEDPAREAHAGPGRAEEARARRTQSYWDLDRGTQDADLKEIDGTVFCKNKYIYVRRIFYI